MARPEKEIRARPDFLDAEGFDTRDGEKLKPSELAWELGVEQYQINKWLKAGYIFKTADGFYLWPQAKDDLEGSDLTRIMPSDELRMENPAPRGGKAPAESQPPAAGAKPPINITREDISSAALIRWLVEAMERQDSTALSGTYQFAKAFEQLLKVEKAQIAMLAERGALISRKDTEETVALAARHRRNIWINTPERIAVEFAEEAGINHRLAHDLLKKHIEATLETIANGSGDPQPGSAPQPPETPQSAPPPAAAPSAPAPSPEAPSAQPLPVIPPAAAPPSTVSRPDLKPISNNQGKTLIESPSFPSADDAAPNYPRAWDDLPDDQDEGEPDEYSAERALELEAQEP